MLFFVVFATPNERKPAGVGGRSNPANPHMFESSGSKTKKNIIGGRPLHVADPATLPTWDSTANRGSAGANETHDILASRWGSPHPLETPRMGQRP